MDIDLTSLNFDSTVKVSSPNGSPTTFSNIQIEPTTGLQRLYAQYTPQEFSFDRDASVEGFLTGRRFAGGQLYPR